MRELYWVYLLGPGCAAASCVGLASASQGLSGLAGASSRQALLRRLASVTSDPSNLIVAALVLSVPATLALNPTAVDREALSTVLVLLMVLLVVEAVGTSKNLLSTWQVGAEIAAATALSQCGLGIALSSVEGVNFVLNVIWFVAITSAFRLISATPEHSLDLAVCTGATLFALASTNGQILVAVLAINLTGSVAGFLVYSYRKPLTSRTHIGVVGFFLAYLAVQIDGPVNQTERVMNALIPVLVFSFALFNMTLVLISRVLVKDNRIPGGVVRSLVTIGIRPNAVRLLLVSTAAAIGILTYMSYRTSVLSSVLLAGLLCLIFLHSGALIIRLSLRSKNEGFVIREPHMTS